MMTQDDIDKVECLIGYVIMAGQGKCGFPNPDIIAVSVEATEWLEEKKKELKP